MPWTHSLQLTAPERSSWRSWRLGEMNNEIRTYPCTGRLSLRSGRWGWHRSEPPSLSPFGLPTPAASAHENSDTSWGPHATSGMGRRYAGKCSTPRMNLHRVGFDPLLDPGGGLRGRQRLHAGPTKVQGRLPSSKPISGNSGRLGEE